MTRVALLSADTCVQDRLAAGLGADRYAELVTSLADLGGAGTPGVIQILGEPAPDVVVFGPGIDTMEALCIAETVEREHPEVTMVLVAEPSADLWELALQAGIRFVVSPNDPPGQVTAVVERALALSERRREKLVVDLRDAAPAPPVGGDDPRDGHRVITVLSPKGGSGKTTVASNLAVGLAQASAGAAIVDLDLQFGDVADVLRLQPTHTLADLVPGAVDGAAVKLLLTRHDCGLYALCGPDDPAAGEEVSIDAVSSAVRALSADLPFVVVDTGAGIEAAALSAVELSTDLVLVGAMDVPSIRSLRKLLDALDRLGMTAPQRHVVLNRADSRVGIEPGDVEDILGVPISVAMPSSRSIPLSVNHGEPLLLSDPRSPVARPLHELVATFTGVPMSTATPEGGRWFRRSSR